MNYSDVITDVVQAGPVTVTMIDEDKFEQFMEQETMEEGTAKLGTVSTLEEVVNVMKGAPKGAYWDIGSDGGKMVYNIFCPTGPGGGVDATCSPGGGGKTGHGNPDDPTYKVGKGGSGFDLKLPAAGSVRYPGGGKGQALYQRDVDRALSKEPKAQVPEGTPTYDPKVDADTNGDGVTDHARVGVGAHDVPPPPSVGALPNLTPQEREVEQAFMKAFNDDPQLMADQFRETVMKTTKAGEPPTFGTDDAKVLSPVWAGDQLSLEERSQNRAIYNLALHQTANAVTKRAFIDHLDTLKEGDQILVTVGGCGAGKGYALGNVDETKTLKSGSKAVWDSAGDQNATENPWIQREAEARGLKVTYAYVNADPKTSWADEKAGVVQRAQNPKDGRMVDAKVFADSYAIGARNHQAFYEAHKDNPNASFVFLQNTIGETPTKLDGIPKEALSHDRKELAKYAMDVIDSNPKIPSHVRRGATIGARIWQGD